MSETPGGLNQIYAKALKIICDNDKQLNRYSLAKKLKLEKVQGYRIAKKFSDFCYIEIIHNKLISTEFGRIVSKRVNNIYKKQKWLIDMGKIKCKKCGKEVDCEVTCIDCSSKELKGDENTCPCDFCEKELLGRTADKEITLFYKDADKDYNFCSKKCLMKFIEESLK